MNQQELDNKLIRAAKEGNVAAIETLLSAGANVNAGEGQPLRWAAVRNNGAETVRMLLRAGADVHAVNDLALRWAAVTGRVETIQVLLDEGADIHAKNDYSLSWAAQHERVKTVQMLLQAGANHGCISFQILKKFLTPKFLLSLPWDTVAKIEAQSGDKKYQWRQKITLLSCIEKENFFAIRNLLADLYYRPGEAGYYQAIMF